MKWLASIVVIFTISVFFVIFLFGWMHANIDSYFYYAFGEFVRTGTYPFQPPFVYTRPTTISHTLYGLFFTFTHNLPRADILLHAIQLLLLAATAHILYKTLRLHLAQRYAIVVSCLFALLPVNLVYAGNVMTENSSQFAVMLIVYLLATGNASTAALVASIGTLLKYNLGIYVPLAFVYFLKKPKRSVYPILGMFLLTSWMLINHSITGVWGLYDTRGTQLYNQFVAQTKFLPPETDPSLIRMRQLLPPGTDVAVPYWDIQEQLSEKLGHEWTKIDQALFDVSWASVRSHPIEYLLHSLKNYALIHYDHVPHWRNVGNIGVAGLSGTDAPFCGSLGSVKICQPIIKTHRSYQLWNAFVRSEMRLFEALATPLFYLLFLPSLCVALLSAKRLPRLYAFLYLGGTVPIAFTIHADPRYVVPFYPLAVLIIVTALQDASNVIGNIRKRDHKDDRYK